MYFYKIIEKLVSRLEFMIKNEINSHNMTVRVIISNEYQNSSLIKIVLYKALKIEETKLQMPTPRKEKKIHFITSLKKLLK